MTAYEHFMLSICFGAVMGLLIGEAGILIGYGIAAIKKRIRKRKEKKNEAE